ncbi:MAG: hypothetical protein Hyperionvirus2_61 [Hyperionvirus sp.]|uniref:Uncharacterized protein n=1 Tax=Hyperionvirus sp. TaxID=2487770 RepID=A0A3G5AA15_9VIRU|nr:MAG: hypothetical protein Hyperionvirus2_61 [Hyperionvirus sp.]
MSYQNPSDHDEPIPLHEENCIQKLCTCFCLTIPIIITLCPFIYLISSAPPIGPFCQYYKAQMICYSLIDFSFVSFVIMINRIHKKSLLWAPVIILVVACFIVGCINMSLIYKGNELIAICHVNGVIDIYLAIHAGLSVAGLFFILALAFVAPAAGR